MAREPPDHCPRCGSALYPVDPPGRFQCPSCEEPVVHYPAPCTRLAILDGDAILLVKVDHPEAELWGTPGGMVEVNEDPADGAARELREETTLWVDPGDLVFFDARSFPKFGRFHKTYLCYAVAAEAVEGSPRANDEIVAARYWTEGAFTTADARLLTSWPADYRDLRWWIDSARSALGRD